MHYLTKFFLGIFMSLMLCTGAFAGSVADIKSDVIQNLQKDGYLSEKMAAEAANKYISQADKASRVEILTSDKAGDKVEVKTSQVGWTEYLSWVNFFKVIAVSLFLFAFSGVIKTIIQNMWHIIALVPAFVYQSVFLVATVFGTIYPEKIWAAEAFYVVLFCSVANLMVISWIVASYPKLQEMIAKILHIGIPPESVASFFVMIYFGALAIAHQSSIFGFFAAIALSGVFTFSLVYVPGVLFLNFKENALSAMVVGHTLVLIAYVAVYHWGGAAPYITYFNAGIQYYCSLALGVALLVGASPFYKPSKALGYFLFFIVLAGLASFAYFFLGMTVMATTLFIFFALVVIEWVGYIGFQGGWIVGCGVLGGILYATSLVLESHGGAILNNLKTVLS